MALIPITHVRTLRSAADAVGLFRALREKRVAVRGLHTTDPSRIARVVNAVLPKREHTVSWERGSLASARGALDRLALAEGYGYLDLRTATTNLRIWPERYAWVHHDGAPNFETTSIAEALARFHAVSGDVHERGFAMRLGEATKPRLIEFLVALEAEVHALIEVELETARELTELYAGDRLEWGADGIFVRFPAGEIAGFLKTPKVDDKHRAKWHARIDKALRKI